MHTSKKGIQPKSALTLLQEEADGQSSQEPLCLIEHPSFPLHLGLTALAGPAGSGKTQICLSLVADCACKHQTSVVVSLGSDNTGRISKRLHQLLQYRTGQTNQETLLRNVFVNWVRNQEDLLELLERKLPNLLTNHPTISVVVLDGMAALFRGHAPERVKSQWLDRSVKFFQIASICKKLSFAHQVPFLVTNEATTKIYSTSIIESTLEPALGLSWAQSVNASLFVHRGPSRIRRLTTIKSPHVTSTVVGEFTIERQGAERIKASNKH